MAELASSEQLKIFENHSLKPYTTFKIGGPALFFAPVGTRQEIGQALKFARSKRLPIFVLGGGSNVLISDAGVEMFAIHPANRSIAVTREEADQIWVTAQAGETWDEFVAYVAERGWWGIENLSHIPGQVGAALVQNIGAYGQQIGDVLESVEVLELASGNVQWLSRAECGLGYRRSTFNTTQKGSYLILAVTLRLQKSARPNLVYPDVERWFGKSGKTKPSITEIRRAIIAIRDRKFPFPRQEAGGNAGSFFKNLVLSGEQYALLEKRFRKGFGAAEVLRLQELRKRFSSPDGVKLPTAFLIEICGLKECRIGGAEVNPSQPLVLLNRGGATARDVMLLAQKIRMTIFARTGLSVDIEPELIGFTEHQLKDYLALE